MNDKMLAFAFVLLFDVSSALAGLTDPDMTKIELMIYVLISTTLSGVLGMFVMWEAMRNK